MNRTLIVRASFVHPARALILALGLATAAASVACGGGGSSGGGGSGRASSGTVGSPSNPSNGGGGSSTGGVTTGGGGSATPGTTTPPPAPMPSSGARLGMNLHFFSYYMAEWPYVDVMKTGQTATGGLGWDMLNPKGLPAPALDADGWPKGLGDGQVVSTVMARSTGGNYPGGAYTLMFEGAGEVQVSLDAAAGRFASDGTGTATHKVNVTPTGNGIQVRITRSSPSNHVRNVRLVMPGFETSHATQPFHPLFLERLRPFAVLRFMDWGRTNGSPVVRWSDRTPGNWRSHASTRGVAWEQMIALSNTLGKDPWICIPHQANDDYVRQLATLFRDKLSPNLKVHVEYSNEVWNYGFTQFKYVENAGKAAGRIWQAQYTTRAVQCFKIFEDVLGGKTRLVRVLGAHTANSWTGQQIINAMPAGAADAIAIAPYFGGSLGNSKNAGTTRNLSVEQILDACLRDIESQRAHVKTYKAMATKAGLRLIAYEGGQHLNGVGSYAEDAQLTAKFIAANRHPRMQQVYRDYLAMWKLETNELFAAYAFATTPSKHGSWGALEYLSQPLTPKYLALQAIAQEWHGGAR